LVAGRALRPLDAMATTAEEIGQTQDLSRRLPEGSVDDEIGRLQRSFNQMLRQLEDAYQRLQSALVAQRRFVADASHELRSPLTTIRGNVGLLLKRTDITSDDRVAALNDIAGESERMSRMVQDLLTLARADAGYHLEKSPVDLEPIIQDVSRQAQTLQPFRRVELQDGVPTMVQGNADALKQLLWILVDNALKHTPEGGRIRMRLGSAGMTAELAVADDGPGIPAEDIERIFERFYQADAARSGEGTGLGLAIARWIAEEHGGRVFAGNNPGGGAIFTVQLPATKVLVNS
jgi:signal transduction histidine kinase